MSLNCLIVDDDIVSVSQISHFIKNTSGLHLMDSFTDSIEGCNYLRKHISKVDLLFLDIEMPEMTGLELLGTFENPPPTVLITSQESYAVEAFDQGVVHYLVKPVEYGKFLQAFERVIEESSNSLDTGLDFIFIKENSTLHKVLNANIMYCEALGDYVKVYTPEKVYVANSTMRNIESKLSVKKQFIRVHRSYIINLDYLKNLDSESCYVQDRIIPIGNKYKSELQSRLNII